MTRHYFFNGKVLETFMNLHEAYNLPVTVNIGKREAGLRVVYLDFEEDDLQLVEWMVQKAENSSML